MKPTRAELIVTAKGQVGALYAVTGKNMMQLRSHTMVFLNETMPITLVPRDVAPSDFYVIFAGLNTSDIELEKKKTHLVRRKVVDPLLDCYKDGIQGHYLTDPRNECFFEDGEEIKILHALVHDAGVDSTIIKTAEEPSSRPGQQRHPNGLEIKTSALFCASQAAIKQVRICNDDGKQTFNIAHSSQCISERNREHDLYAFPHLHSNGLATVYDEKRAVRVPPAKARAHLLSIALRTFAQDPLWTFVQFDSSNKSGSQGLLSARLKQNPQIALAAVHVTEEELQKQLKYQFESRSALISGARMPSKPEQCNAQYVLNHLQSVQKVIRGSDEERKHMRHAMYALAQQIGHPHCMLTFTPNSYANALVSIIASGGDASLYGCNEEEFLFDLSDTKSSELTQKIQTLASSDPAACAQYFEEIKDHLLREVLGIDIKHRQAREGYLGEVEYVGGGIENQGSQLLHFHVCIRFRNWPKWLDKLKSIDEIEVEKRTQDSTFLNEEQKLALVDFTNNATFPVYEIFKVIKFDFSQ